MRSFASSAPLAKTPASSLYTSSLLSRSRPLIAAFSSVFRGGLVSVKALSTQATSSSLNDPNPNWPPKEMILLDGCDFEHWLVVVDPPEGEPTRDAIIDSYIKTLAQVVGSEEEARMKIYSVSTRCYFGFGALVSEDLCHKLKELPKVRWVFPDYYLDVRNKDYGGLKKGKRKPKDDSETEVNLKKPIKVNLKKPKKEDVIKEEILLCLRRIETKLTDRLDLVLNGLIVEVVVVCFNKLDFSQLSQLLSTFSTFSTFSTAEELLEMVEIFQGAPF